MVIECDCYLNYWNKSIELDYLTTALQCKNSQSWGILSNKYIEFFGSVTGKKHLVKKIYNIIFQHKTMNKQYPYSSQDLPILYW